MERPIVGTVVPVNAPPPTAADILGFSLNRLRAKPWRVFVGNSRFPIVVLLPKGWTVARLSLDMADKAVKSGIPVLACRKKEGIGKNGGLVILDPSGRAYNPQDTLFRFVWDGDRISIAQANLHDLDWVYY